jgi:signal peptidase I
MNANCDETRNLPMASHKGLLIFACGLIGLLLVFRAHFSLYIAKGESMLPGLRSGDLVLVDKLAYRATDPERGDIVVALEGNDLIVKRVVGLPGEEVELRRGELYVNRRPLAEEYAVEPGWLSLQRGRLLEDRYALLGDNRSVSSSVFVHAVVSKDQILGKVIHSVRLWPGWLRPGCNQAADTAVAATKGKTWTF